MIEFLLILLLLLLVGVFGVVLGVHLQAAKSKTDCGCGGKKADSATARRLTNIENWIASQVKSGNGS